MDALKTLHCQNPDIEGHDNRWVALSTHAGGGLSLHDSICAPRVDIVFQ